MDTTNTSCCEYFNNSVILQNYDDDMNNYADNLECSAFIRGL